MRIVIFKLEFFLLKIIFKSSWNSSHISWKQLPSDYLLFSNNILTKIITISIFQVRIFFDDLKLQNNIRLLIYLKNSKPVRVKNGKYSAISIYYICFKCIREGNKFASNRSILNIMKVFFEKKYVFILQDTNYFWKILPIILNYTLLSIFSPLWYQYVHNALY